MWNRCGDNDQIANRDLKLKFISIRKVKTEEEKLKHTVKTEEEKVKHTHRFKDRICRLQDRGAVQGRSESRWRGIAHRRGGREAQRARGGIREQNASLGHEMRGPAVTERGGVSMAWGQEGQSEQRGIGVKRLRQIGAEMV